MLNKLKELREDHEDGFTLIELLVVILIIGILASIAIPVFLNQRKTANDGAVESDVKNAATVVETWIVAQKGANPQIDIFPSFATDIKGQIKASAGVHLAIRGTANDYCIVGAHQNGKNYVHDKALAPANTPKVLSYNNSTGGMGKACSTGNLSSDWNLANPAS